MQRRMAARKRREAERETRETEGAWRKERSVRQTRVKNRRGELARVRDASEKKGRETGEHSSTSSRFIKYSIVGRNRNKYRVRMYSYD